MVSVRWESALPVRAAKLNVREIGTPGWEGDGEYVIAAYNVPFPAGRGQNPILQRLKASASLRRDGKTDWKPSGVEPLPRSNGLPLVLYRFPRSHEITPKDERIVFESRIDRLVVGVAFEVREIRFQGELELYGAKMEPRLRPAATWLFACVGSAL